MKEGALFIISKGLSVAKNCHRTIAQKCHGKEETGHGKRKKLPAKEKFRRQKEMADGKKKKDRDKIKSLRQKEKGWGK